MVSEATTFSSATDAKRRAGNAGGRPVRASSRRAGDPPAIPASLGARGQAVWVRLWSAAPHLSPDVHGDAMTVLCRAFDEWETWDAEVRKHPMVKGSMGQRQPNKAAAQKQAVEASIRSWMKHLGLFSIREESTTSDLDDFLTSSLAS